MIGQKIYYFRKSNGMTQEQLAHGICSVSHLSKIENGHEQPSQDILEHLCRRLKITLNDIDATKTENEFGQLLDNWYNAILYREEEKIDSLYETIREKQKRIQAPQLLLKWQLFYSRYLIYREKLDEAENQLHIIKEHFKTLEGDIKYLYYTFVGIVTYNKGNYADSIDYFKKAEVIMDEIRIKDPELYYRLALAYSQIYQISQSNYYTNKAVELYQSQYNFRRSIECEIILGINSRRVNFFDQAKKHYHNALRVAKENNDKENISIIYHNLGVIYRNSDDIQKSNEYYFECLKYREPVSLEDIDDIARTYYCLSENYLKLKDYGKMQEYIKKGLRIIGDASVLYHWRLHFKVLECKADLYSDEEFERILKDEAIPFFLNKKLFHYVADYSEMLADYYYKQFKYKQASYYYKFANDSRKKMTFI